jgi:hypothetical protein
MQTISMSDVSPLLYDKLKGVGVSCTCYCNELPRGEGFAAMMKNMLVSSHPLICDVSEKDAVAALCYRDDETEYVVAFAMLYATFAEEDSVCFVVECYGGEHRFFGQSPLLSIVSGVESFVSHLVDHNPFIARVVAEVPGTDYQIAWLVTVGAIPSGFDNVLWTSGYQWPGADDYYPYITTPSTLVYVKYFCDDTSSSPSAAPDTSAHSSDDDSLPRKVARVA